MAENIREVIARMKSNQQSSQTSQNRPTPAPNPRKQEVQDAEDDYIDEETGEEVPEKQEIVKAEAKDVKVDPQLSAEQQVMMEIEMLQNDGRFRVELLHQLLELNKAMVVMAGSMVDLINLFKNDKK